MSVQLQEAQLKEQVRLTDGNEAVAWGALYAGCRHYFGYPITPQNEITEFMSREMPRYGGVFIQTESESGSIYILHGAAVSGVRAMTSTSGPGFSLMQEGISWIVEHEAPAVIVDVQRVGPGCGGGGPGGQVDYFQVTKPSGHGNYRLIVLAASGPQEAFDLTQLAFHLAEKHRILVIVVSDFLVARMQEPVDMKTIDFGPLPEKPWALVGKGKKEGNRAFYFAPCLSEGVSVFYDRLAAKYKRIKENEVRYESYLADDADCLLVAYGSTARMAKRAVELGRAEGLKLGLFRPVTLWPFPEQQLLDMAVKAGKVLVIEDGPEGLAEDVRYKTLGRVPVHFLGYWGRHVPTTAGVIYPERILEEVKSLR